MLHRVLVTDNLSAAGLKVLEENPEIELVIKTDPKLTVEQLREELQEADGIVIRSGTRLTEEVLEGQSRLKAIVRAGVGVDNIDIPAATRQGIVVMNTPGGNTISTAEHTIAMMMSLSRNIAPAAASMREGKWERKLFTGTQLATKTIGVVGLGRVGLAVAQRALGLEMKVLGYDPFISAERAAEFGIELHRDIDDLIPHCDYISVHTPLTDETRGIINAERIAKMPRGVRIINCARGGIVDEGALADAVESGHVAGAALDVFTVEPPKDTRLTGLPGVLTTPHLGASTDEAQELVAVEAGEIISAFLTRNEVRHAVNMAPVSASEMEGMKKYIDLAHRLGLVLSQQTHGEGIRSAEIHYRGDVASKHTRLLTSSFTAGLLSGALGDRINIVNANLLAEERGVPISEETSKKAGDFSTMIIAEVTTDQGTLRAGGTLFGREYLRLVLLDDYQLDGYLDGTMMVYRHKDVPGLIGAVGTTLGKHKINIGHMALGRETEQPGGDSIAVFNLDTRPSDEIIEEIRQHPDVTDVEIVQLPAAGAPLPWLGL
ncbi:MAG: phosphoglycerate dehydrogenase [Rubinisphaera brasiliensis]|uniref:D-3-phosphoglycerate dehydrogenase n=1 Tax=Rubinisphaera brasiliensis (strain ATCC 49424 / DSM 5305 / JCM 21570 / IAM 15109 / NBRC 103401 / IFAM 1448) TaxID=756272 RepID=F0ST08_RUBBR|nr:phosphoglycerate dehydrogenase [Rubinisphaera brasiliensis]ADY58163.1 D-3-phosphoglycerate dehydrogenase [Rubinisphaera brasiliensis DSM 5305]MBB03296.1 phosphoglycerate dehydrogenase [Planctomyces sp.]